MNKTETQTNIIYRELVIALPISLEYMPRALFLTINAMFKKIKKPNKASHETSEYPAEIL